MEIGKKLKDARMKSGFTQETVAEKVNVSRQTISNWENEKSYPDIISVIELSSLYSISMFLPDKIYYLIMVFCLAIVSSAVLLYQIIRRI